ASRWEPGPKHEPHCWYCGAPNAPGSSECWLCQRRDWNRYSGRRTRDTRSPDLPRRGPMSTIAGLMTGVAICGVVLGLFHAAPGLAAMLLVCMAPALAITELKARGRRLRGDPMSIGERTVRVIVLTILIPVLVAVALAIALFTFCFFLSLR